MSLPLRVRASVALTFVFALLSSGVVPAQADVTVHPNSITSCSLSPATSLISKGDEENPSTTQTLNGTATTIDEFPNLVRFYYEYTYNGIVFESGSYYDVAGENIRMWPLDSWYWFYANTTWTRSLFAISSDLTKIGTALCTWTVNYGPDTPSYTITIGDSANGSAAAAPSTVASGGTSTLTATANTGYVFASWTCTGGVLSSAAANPATLSSITSNVTCTPAFQAASDSKNFGHSGKSADPKDRNRTDVGGAPSGPKK